LLVLLGHAAHTPGFPAFLKQAIVFDTAHFGVNVFFVLSGFLITSLLIEEHRRTGSVSLRDFYIRRTIRIFPAAYSYVAVVALLAWLRIASLQQGDLVHALTYTMNYHHHRAWALGHLWSLGVEEQFYLLWPLSFLMLGEQRARTIALGVLVFAPLCRVSTWLLFPNMRIGIDEEFQTVCDGLATGCLIGMLAARYGTYGLISRIPRAVFLLAPVAAVLSNIFARWPSFFLPFGATISNLSLAVIMLWCIGNARSWLGRLLNLRAAIFLGTISYSLYLWQQLFMDGTFMQTGLRFPVNVSLAVMAAVGSYYLIERPLQGLRRRFRR
jgi:peptidoglycan/LPS O-acetylase OafA/YrhL